MLIYIICREGYLEKCVMNNYFGIGLDAKISLEFNNKREEHPEKCRSKRLFLSGFFVFITRWYEFFSLIAVFSCGRSRTKNMMWYGVLGTKELLQRTYKNLEQKVQLEVWQETENCTNSIRTVHVNSLIQNIFIHLMWKPSNDSNVLYYIVKCIYVLFSALFLFYM